MRTYNVAVRYKATLVYMYIHIHTRMSHKYYIYMYIDIYYIYIYISADPQRYNGVWNLKQICCWGEFEGGTKGPRRGEVGVDQSKA